MKQNILSLGALVSIGIAVGVSIGFFLPQSMQTSQPEARIQTQTIEERHLIEEESATISVVEHSLPAVVSVVAYRPAAQYQRIFGQSFVLPNTSEDSSEDLRESGGGSGFIISADGTIVTNRHVVDDDDATYKVVLQDGREFDAVVLAKDPVQDLAILDIEADDLPTIALGDSTQLKIGQTVIAIGNALAEFGNSVTRGVVSGIGRTIEAGDRSGRTEVLQDLLQTDAAINPGNSGGPLINLSGEVIGINTAVVGNGQSIGFAIPIDHVKRSIDSVQQHGRIVRPWLGVRYIMNSPEIAAANNLDIDTGAIVLRGATPTSLAVIPGSPADKAGIEEYTIITEIGGVPIDESHSLARLINQYQVGESVDLTILKEAEKEHVSVTLEEFPE